MPPPQSARRKINSRAFRSPIAILTDFGYRDHYVGVMKGVIAGIAPAARTIDITHGIPAQSIIAGAIALKQSWRYFPTRTVFLAVVDPESAPRGFRSRSRPEPVRASSAPIMESSGPPRTTQESHESWNFAGRSIALKIPARLFMDAISSHLRQHGYGQGR